MKHITAAVTGVVIAMLTSISYAESVADKRGLTLEGAKKVIAATVAEAKRVNAPGGSIAIVDDGGNLLALEHF
jgi:glc operon protein GlcG